MKFSVSINGERIMESDLLSEVITLAYEVYDRRNEIDIERRKPDGEWEMFEHLEPEL